jgi:hypothetical protein
LGEVKKNIHVTTLDRTRSLSIANGAAGGEFLNFSFAFYA